MEKYLITLDLDGTILPGLYDVSNYTIKVFSKLAELGHKIVIITGRPFRSSFFVYYKCHLDTPICNYNGQYITNPKDNNYKPFSLMIDRKIILDIYNKMKGNYLLFFSEAYDNIYSSMDREDVRLLMHHNSLSSLFVGDLNDILDSNAHGTLILANEGKGKVIKEYVESTYKELGVRLWKWGPYDEIVELYIRSYSKASAMKKVMDDLGFDKEHTISCIDSRNDIDLIAETGLSVCPSDAEEIIKEKADIVLDKKCNEDAIALYFNERFNLGIKR